MKLPFRYIVGIIFFSCSLHAEQEIRIAIGKPFTSTTLRGSGLVASSEGKELAKRDTLTLSTDNTGVVIDGVSSKSQIVQVSSPGQIAFEGRQYRNSLEVKWQLENGAPKLSVVHPLPLEIYVAGIIASEVPNSWPLEALKAQAIAARTFALWQKFRRLDKNYHMESSVIDQVYGGAQKEHAMADRAAKETYGEVLTHNGKPTHAYFHASCGGHTESAISAWGTAQPYLPGSQCGFCSSAPKYRWSYSISRGDLDRVLSRQFSGHVTHMSVGKRTPAGRAKTIEISAKRQKKEISAATFRELLGYNNIGSTLIDNIAFGTHNVTISGRGHGHGVGMCQWGALGMAKAGLSATKILERYYPGAEIRRVY